MCGTPKPSRTIVTGAERPGTRASASLGKEAPGAVVQTPDVGSRREPKGGEGPRGDREEPEDDDREDDGHPELRPRPALHGLARVTEGAAYGKRIVATAGRPG